MQTVTGPGQYPRVRLYGVDQRGHLLGGSIGNLIGDILGLRKVPRAQVSVLSSLDTLCAP